MRSLVRARQPIDRIRGAATVPETALLGALVASLALASRLPFLLSRGLPLDGDEAILGLAAVQLLEGRTLPVFFPGQRYGFSLLEAGAGAASFWIFGVSEPALRGAMLLLWTLGAVFTVWAVRELAGRRATLPAVALVVFCPAWGLWSTKARGGYVTAFLLTGVLLHLVARTRARPSGSTAASVALGACAGLLLFSQPLWLLSLAPLLGLAAYTQRGGERVAAAAGFGAAVAVLYGASRASTFVYTAALLRDVDVLRALSALPARVWVCLSGLHISTTSPSLGPLTAVAGTAWCSLLLATLGWAGARLARTRRLDVVTALAFGVVAVLAGSLAIGAEFAFRYLLPIATPLAVVSAIGWCSIPALRGRLATALGVGAVTLVGMGAFIEQAALARHADGSAPEPARVRALVEALAERGIAHVYSSDPLFQWNLMFASHQRVLARWLPATDRMPDIPPAVDRARREGRPTALVGLVADPDRGAEVVSQLRADGHAAELVAGRFVVLERPSAELLRSLGFELDEPAAGAAP
jgi:hypothetical protein